MKKSLLILATLMMTTSVFAAEYTGRVTRLNQDEEGTKVVLQEEKENHPAVLLYLDNKSKDYSQKMSDLKLANENATKILVKTTDCDMKYILKIQALGN